MYGMGTFYKDKLMPANDIDLVQEVFYAIY